MKRLLVDPMGGAAGDMFVGALIHLGVDASRLRSVLASLGLADWRLEIESTQRRHLGCTWARFIIPEEHGHRHLPEIIQRIEASALSTRARARAVACFQHLGEAEARAHEIPIERVHFHEVGAADAILDICGVCHALDGLDIDELWVAALPAGTGTIRCAHGDMPCPAPAVVHLLEGFDLLLGVGDGEMVTPTAAAIIKTYGTPLRQNQGVAGRVLGSGYGAGTREQSIMRVTSLELDAQHPAVPEGLRRESVLQFETNIDDRSPEQLAYAADRCFENGAVDVAFTPSTMKKSRPGQRMTVLAPLARRHQLLDVLFRETGTFGVREQIVERWVAERETLVAETVYGPIRVQSTRHSFAPEHDDCASAAMRMGVAYEQVYRAALAAGGRLRAANEQGSGA